MSIEYSSNNKRIAKNAVYMYIRLLITTIVGLYTSRIILQKLGVVDFGIYGVVGSIVTIFSTLNSTMAIATYRYLNIAVGRKDQEFTKKVFSTSLCIHFAIAAILVLFAECVGPWFIENELTIPIDRMDAAQWTFQFSIVTCVFMIISAPYNSTILVHERMNIYAYFAIFDAAFKLLIVLLIGCSSVDKLIEYSLYLCLFQIIMRFAYNIYCKRNFEECVFRFRVDFNLVKEMTGFTGWNILHCIANILYTEGLNMILNVFYGPVVNAARSVAIQIQSKVMLFGRNLQEAFNPQIMKSYSYEDYNYMHQLIMKSSKYSFLLLYILIFPICLETDFILRIWLGEYPEYSTIFVRLILVTILIDAMQNPLLTSVHSTGKIKWYSIIMSFILICILPIAYCFLYSGFQPHIVFIIQIFIMAVGGGVSIIFCKRQTGLVIKDYFKETVFPLIYTIVFSIPLPVFLFLYLDHSNLHSLLIMFTAVIMTVVSTCFVGLDSKEMIFIKTTVKKYIK